MPGLDISDHHADFGLSLTVTFVMTTFSTGLS